MLYCQKTALARSASIGQAHRTFVHRHPNKHLLRAGMDTGCDQCPQTKMRNRHGIQLHLGTTISRR